MSVKVFYADRPRQLSEVVKYETHPDYSRESGTALAGEEFDLGQVLGKVTVSGKLVVLDPAATDGSEDVVGVAQTLVEAGADDVEFVVYSRRATIFSASGLRWPPGITAPQKAAALAQMEALGLVVRNF